MALKSIDAIESSYQKVMLNKKVGQNLTLVSNEAFEVDFTDCECPKLISPKTGRLRYC